MNRPEDCHHEGEAAIEQKPCCHTEEENAKIDWLLWISMVLLATAYVVHLVWHGDLGSIPFAGPFCNGVFELFNKMWWGLLAGVVLVSALAKVPREFVVAILGPGGGFAGLLRATFAGLLLDLCSHGILLVGMQLYLRGASLGQTMAFLVASPWNSLSLTIILIALIGWKWTLAFVSISAIIEVCSEGSSPVAADLLNRAGAPGNAMTFLMAGATTDYTEILGLKETTKSWKIALFLPLVTVPQVLVVGWLLNHFAT